MKPSLLLPVLAAMIVAPATPTLAARRHEKPAPAATPPPDAAEQAFLETLASAQCRFTPATKAAYLAMREKRALAAIAAKAIAIPADFLAWVKGDPLVYETVFGMRADPAPTLLRLLSLETDLGPGVVRKDYKQLALATAVRFSEASQPWPDMAPHAPFRLVIPTAQPNARVDTKDPKRTLDRDDHIVNFFLDHAPIRGEMVGGMLRELPELVYDNKGVAVQPKGAGKKEPVLVERKLIPADVLASRKLQIEFNGYMKSKGFPTDIDCGDRVVYPGLHDAIKRTPQYKGIVAAYNLFKDAFEKKGLLSVRDAAPTPSEHLAFLIRNDRTKLPPERAWPRYPLDAPWPTLVLLAADRTPLREAEDLWRRFADKGELHTYGEYIGAIAQDFTGQNARRLAPFEFGYGSTQMKLKDGGVCGTMASICANEFNVVGIPATPAGQPGHCALIAMNRNAKSGLYVCAGKQFVTADESGTHPSAAMPLADIDSRRPMIDYECEAWGVNVGTASFLDSVVAYNMSRLLPKTDRAKNARSLIGDAADANPFFFPMIESAFAGTANRAEVVALFDRLKTSSEALRARSGSGDIFARHLAQLALDRIGGLPEDAATADAVKGVEAYAESVRKPPSRRERKLAKKAADAAATA